MKKIIFILLNIFTISLYSQIEAVTEIIDYQNMPNGSSSISVLANDLLNNATPTANDVTITGINFPNNWTMNPDGTLNVALGTPAASYIFSYRICEIANPNNCSLTTSVLNLTTTIQAITETFEYQNAPNSPSSISVLTNDLLNNETPTPNNVNVSGINMPSGFTLNPDGTFIVAQGIQAGSYSFSYRICEIANPDNCSVTTSAINVISNIQAITEIIDYQNIPNGPISISVLANDLLNNTTPTANDVTITGINFPSTFSFNPDGTLNVALGTPAASYIFSYRICEIANPNNCSVTTSVLNLTSNIVANNDVLNFETPPENGSTVSVLDNDILNNLIPNSSNVTVSFINIPAGFTLNTDGTLTISSNLTQGNFSLDYKICETAFPANCTNANASIVIANPFPPSGDVVQNVPVSGTLAGLQVNGQNILWYASNTNRNSSSTSNSSIPSSTLVVVGTTYYASQTVNSIESIDRLPVTISNSLSATNFDFASLKVSPNPVNENLNISNENSITEIEFYTISGQSILSQKPNTMQCEINVATLSNGIYFVKISSENKSKIIKIKKK